MESTFATTDFSAERISGLRAALANLRTEVRRRYDQGATGVQVAATQSSANDTIVVQIWKSILSQLTADQQGLLQHESAILAIGGSGRGEAAPYSDIDLLLLHHPSVTVLYQEIAAQFVRDCWDVGVKIGHSVRTPADTLRMARADLPFATSLVDIRCLWGSASLVQNLERALIRLLTRSQSRQFVANAIAARRIEREECGGAVQQLEPDVKRAFGGLRDIHLIRWIGFARYGVSDLNSLKLRGAFDQREGVRLIQANDFLLGVRMHLHFAAGRANEILTRAEQVKLAESRDIEGTTGQLPVERLMQQYFRHTTTIADVAERMARDQRYIPWSQRLVDYVMTYRVDEIYRVGPHELSVPPRHRPQLGRSLEQMLELFLAAARYRVTVSHAVCESLREALAARPPEEVLSPEAARLFLLILKTTGHLGRTLRTMYDIGLLEAVLPVLRHIRCLLQFNQYHHFTVDEHTLRAIDVAERLETQEGPLGSAYQELEHKELLFLALLLHDAGKGYEEDHSEVGRRIAIDAAKRLGLAEHQADLLVFLVHRHLVMAHLAFRRDTADPEVLLNFSRDVGSAEALRLLYVLTAADITSVGPGAWTEWKAELIATLYERCLLWLSGKSYLFDEPLRLSRIRAEVRQLLRTAEGEPASLEEEETLEALPPHYLLATAPPQIADDLKRLTSRKNHEILVDARYEHETQTVDYRVCADETVATGCFHKITGALTAKRMGILSAQICTTADGQILDSYRVKDYDHEGEVPQFRMEEVGNLIRSVLLGERDLEPLLQAQRRARQPVSVTIAVNRPPLRVTIDNESSDRCTVVDVFAQDRPGLLYLITKTLFDLELSVVLAKISTHFDQVVDVFYVTNAAGEKIRDGQRLRLLRQTLTTQVEEFLNS